MRCFLEISENCLFLAVGLQKKVTKVTSAKGAVVRPRENDNRRPLKASSARHRKLVPRRDLLLGAGLATAPDSPMQPLDFFWGLCPACSGKTPPVPY